MDASRPLELRKHLRKLRQKKNKPTFYIILDASLQDIKSALDVHMEGSSREIFTVQKPHGCKMYDCIPATLHYVIQYIDIPDITTIWIDFTCGSFKLFSTFVNFPLAKLSWITTLQTFVLSNSETTKLPISRLLGAILEFSIFIQ